MDSRNSYDPVTFQPLTEPQKGSTMPEVVSQDQRDINLDVMDYNENHKESRASTHSDKFRWIH